MHEKTTIKVAIRNGQISMKVLEKKNARAVPNLYTRFCKTLEAI